MKIVISCIGAAIIIVLASFTSVIGEQKRHSSGMNDSPLFSIRVKRAIKEENKDAITLNYLGKENRVSLSFPQRDDKMEQAQNVICLISRMSEDTFHTYVNVVINKLYLSNQVKKEDIPKIAEALHYIKDNPDKAKSSLPYKQENQQLGTATCGSLCPTNQPNLRCRIGDIIGDILTMIYLIILGIGRYITAFITLF